jgi:hypothetical protein
MKLIQSILANDELKRLFLEMKKKFEVSTIWDLEKMNRLLVELNEIRNELNRRKIEA